MGSPSPADGTPVWTPVSSRSRTDERLAALETAVEEIRQQIRELQEDDPED